MRLCACDVPKLVGIAHHVDGREPAVGARFEGDGHNAIFGLQDHAEVAIDARQTDMAGDRDGAAPVSGSIEGLGFQRRGAADPLHRTSCGPPPYGGGLAATPRRTLGAPR